MTSKPYPKQEDNPQMLGEPAIAYQHTESTDYHAAHSAYAERTLETKALLEERKAEDPNWEQLFQPYTMEQISQRIDEAEANITASNVITGDEFFAELKRDFPWLY